MYWTVTRIERIRYKILIIFFSNKINNKDSSKSVSAMSSNNRYRIASLNSYCQPLDDIQFRFRLSCLVSYLESYIYYCLMAIYQTK